MSRRLLKRGLFHKAAEVGDISLVQQLLDNGENVNATDAEGYTPLELASRNGRDALVIFLLQRGASQDSQNENGSTPLHHACSSGHETTVSILIEGGAKLNAQEKVEGHTPLHDACYFNHKCSLVKILLENGANVNTQTDEGWTALMCSSSRNDGEMVRLLLNHGANANLQENSGKTALHVASVLGSSSVVEPLLEGGAKVYLKDCRGNTPLHRAAEESSFTIMYKLLDKGATIDEKNHFNETPFDLFTTFGLHGNILLDYITKLKMAGVPVKINLDEEEGDEGKDDDEENMEHMKVQCLAELEKIKGTKIDGNFSLNVLFLKFTNPFYLSDIKVLQSLEKTVHSLDLVKRFPVYVGVLKYAFENTKRRFTLLTNASQTLDKIWMKINNFHSCLKSLPIVLPELVKRQILSYLSEVDLDSLISS